MNWIIKLLTCVVVLIILSSFMGLRQNRAVGIEQTNSKHIPPQFLTDSNAWVDSVMNSLSLKEKIAQLMMVSISSANKTYNTEEITELISHYNIGGVIFFKGSPYQQARTCNYLQSKAKTPLLIGIDGEWGLAMRLDSTIRYPLQMTLGATSNDRLIYEMGADIGRQLKRMGIHINFAPVVDINNNPGNPVINSRSFGENRELVTRKSMCYMMGMQDQHILTTAKHFPGHGDTDVDSHVGLPVIKHTYERLDSLELYPYKALIKNGLSGVMVAHLNVQAIDSTPGMATTLSDKSVNQLLKNTLGFQGLVFTDAMNMGGISKFNKPENANLKALQAGNDVLLMPHEIKKTINLIAREIEKGNISAGQVEKSCRKIIAAKYWVGLNNYKPVSLKGLTADLNQPASLLLKQRLIENSLTVLKNNRLILPIKRLDTLKIASISIDNGKQNTLQNYISLYTEADHYYLPKNFSTEQALDIYSKLENYNLVILSIHQTSMFASRNFGINQQSLQFADKLSALKQTILCLPANPYALNMLPQTDSYKAIVLSYEDNEVSQQYTAQLLFGGIGAYGKLPVSTKHYHMGQGIIMPESVRLKYTSPADAEMNSNVLQKIDSVAKKAIAEKATPGCQVLVARNGAVVYHKSFGYHTYLNRTKVKNTDIYDLASITKIAATLPLVMKYQAEGLMDVNKPLSEYLPPLDTTNKKYMLISDILYHQARLKPWIPFYISTLENVYPSEGFSSNTLSEKYPYHVGRGYYINKHTKYKDNYFSAIPTKASHLKVADGMYAQNTIADTIFKRIYQSELRQNEGYRYSDLGFYLLYKAIENTTNKSFDTLVQTTFYNKLGANRISFNPLQKTNKSEIIPTENDIIFRRQIVHGYVHDPGAAMLGGVCGHAGLFANANDLAKFMQMYLNGGTYGGETYLNDSIIRWFTTCSKDNDNRRGLGFDKPEFRDNYSSPVCESASPYSFGHTGFTGTMAWVDPAYNLVYIFLSNRVHPDALNTKLIELNVRTSIQQIIYDAIEK